MTDVLDLDRYFERIGFTGKPMPDLATLSAIHAAHVNAIPFEGINPLLRRPVDLDLPSLQRKLVDSRRGGYCYEHNAVLRAALEAIGFKVTGLGGRVRWNSPPDSPLGPKTHMLLGRSAGWTLSRGCRLRRLLARCAAANPRRCGADHGDGHL